MSRSTRLFSSRSKRRGKQSYGHPKDFKRPEVHDLIITRMESFGNSDGPIPGRVILVRPNPTEPSADQLFIDKMPVPREAWSYDAKDRILRWKGLFGGGHLHLYHNAQGAVGNIGPEYNFSSVSAGAKAQFSCSVAVDCGATYETSGSRIIGFKWDTTSDEWKSAKWIKDRLLLTYTVKDAGPLEPPTIRFEFEDKITGSIPWDVATPGSGSASLKLGERGGWNLVFKSNVKPEPDKGGETKVPDTVYPYWLQAVEDNAASSIDGVMQIDEPTPKGKLVGIQGERVTPHAVGYYRTSAGAAPFGVFDGKLHIKGKPVQDSFLVGHTLHWKGLDSKHQLRTGLPENGSLQFKRDGSSAVDKDNKVRVRRLGTGAAIGAIASHADLHPDVHAHILLMAKSLADSPLDIYGLLAMTPFATNDKGEWGDVVQAAVREDLSEIMNSFIPSDMWKLLFPNTDRPALSGKLAEVAYSPVEGINDPTAWYQSLGTAVMTQGLAGGSDENCKNLNGPRAAAWLKEKVGTSKVYNAHGQQLFQYEWQRRFPQSVDYAADQANPGNKSVYEQRIDSQAQSSIDDINQNVITDSSSPADLKDNMIKEVQEAAAYAKTNQLYWAFYYYTYNTATAILANIAMQIGVNTGSSDGTTLSRLFQQNVTILTALDPSGYFARQYNKTINVFLSTNILPSMYGFTGEAESFDIIKEYLQKFVEQNIDNEDKQIADAAGQIKQILDEKDADEMLKASIEALRSFSEAIQDMFALPYVANEWVDWFAENYPKFSRVSSIFGGVLIGGITGLAMFNLFTDFKEWDKLSAAEKTEVILDAVQLGLQILGAMVKSGVRIYAIFSVDGMSAWQRVGAVSRILAQGEADALDRGLMNISNATARWIGDTAGSLEMSDEIYLLMNIGENDIERVSWTVRIFGKNLDEFIATRIGPLFIIAGIGLSIYFISTGESGVALASDILNIAGGALMIFGIVGGWLIEGGIVAAEGIMATIISFAGPLAVLAAFVGIGLMLFEMFHRPPNPVKEFVDNYAKPAGFYVSSRCSSIDYVIPYADESRDNLMIMGFTLSTPKGSSLCCNPDGFISLGKATALPDCVWQVVTDGVGICQIFTLVEEDVQQGPVVLLLSLMSDDSISFQPKVSLQKKDSASTGDSPTVVTQRWLSLPQNKAKTTNDGWDLVSLGLKFKPVRPDKDGNYDPSAAKGWMIVTESGVAFNSDSGTEFTLAMSAVAPNFMKMADLGFILDSTPSPLQKFAPRFGVRPSTPITYAVSGYLPNFLEFKADTGIFSPNGQKADTPWKSDNVISASNPLGKEEAEFAITVAASAAISQMNQ